MLAILAPMATELTGIRRHVGAPAHTHVSLHVTGIGRQATLNSLSTIAVKRLDAKRSIATFVDAMFPGAIPDAPDAMLMVGFCGAADPSLRTGDLHIATSFRLSAQPGEIPADPNLHSALCAVARRQDGSINTQPSSTVLTIADAATKATHRQSLGAASVNMEDYWAAEVAADASIPFASIRVVLDTADEALPGYLTAGNPALVAMGAVTHPHHLLRLTKLARQARVARRSLTRCVADFVNSRPPAQPLTTAPNA